MFSFRRLGLVALLLLCAAAAGRQDDADLFPILAWGGPPQEQTTVDRYLELAECGFTHNYSGFSSADKVAAALDVAGAAGIKLMVSCPELTSDPEGTAKRFNAHPALGGYFLRDEPPAAAFPELAARAKRIQLQDRAHPCYVNLFPNYAGPEQLGSATYWAYVDRFVGEVPVPVISFDHYPVVGSSLRAEWYQNLEVISAAARRAHKPFWAFALAVAHGPYPVATAAHLRVQAFSNLAYGAQGLEYFTYWTTKSSVWDFHDGPILPDGKRGVVYERVREVNREVQALRGVFLGAEVDSLGHTGDKLPAGTRRYEPTGPVWSFKTDGTGVIVSSLKRGVRRSLVVVNRDINKPMRLTIEFDPAALVREVKKDGATAEVVDGQYAGDVGPGDAAIFSWTIR